MNIRSFKNLLRVTEMGSLTAAAADAHLTVQAIAAQLNKIEDQFGFPLFQRTPKGVTLTEEGQTLMPRIRKLIAASNSLDESVTEIRGQTSRQLRIAMNTTLMQDEMSRLLERLMKAFSGFDIRFSAGETNENMRALRENAVDLAIFLGSAAVDIPFVELDGFHVSIVSAAMGEDTLKGAYDRMDRFLIRPDRSCPYAFGFDEFVRRKLSGFDVDTVESRSVISSSEHLTATLIRQLDAIGILSHDIAHKNSLTVLPDFEVRLPVRLAVDPAKFDGAVGKRLRSLGAVTPCVSLQANCA